MDDSALRSLVEHLLNSGLKTRWMDRAATSEQVLELCQRLQALPPEDVQGKLVLCGLSHFSFVAPQDEVPIEQSCATCMYFERHRQFCNLPELMLPVQAEWSCVLWRI